MTQPLPADPIFAAIEAHRDAHQARAALFGTCRSTERQRKPRTCRGVLPVFALHVVKVG